MLRLVEQHAARVQRRRVAIDLYAGVGFFTLPLARQFERVISVEGSPESYEYAVHNVPPNVKTVGAPVEAWVRDMRTPTSFFSIPRAQEHTECHRCNRHERARDDLLSLL